MRNPQIVLENLQKQSQNSGYQFTRLYRNLYNVDFYLLAYQNLYANKGAMTKGVDGTSLDGFGLNRIGSIIQSLKDHSYQPQPARRHYIPKKNSKKKRPLGIPSAGDKLVQEVVRMILESIYEPSFSKFSHGFRPNRSCHTALNQIQNNFTGVKWFIEGDIKAYFDTIDHHILIKILRKRIKDEYFIALIWKFLRAGYMENWSFNSTFSGTPQGSGVSPILANIYLNELDVFISEYKKNFEIGKERRPDKDYGRVHGTYQRYKEKYASAWRTMTEDEKQKAKIHMKQLRNEFQKYPSKDPLDENYKRIQYVRYADDFIIGIIGSKKDAERIKCDISDYLKSKLELSLSHEKTLITNSKNNARFLGYDVTISNSTDTRKTQRGQSRIYNSKVRLYVPYEKWRGKLLEYGVLKITRDENGKEKWKPLQRDNYMGLESHKIVLMYNAQIRGLYNYYRLANNVSVLNKFYYVMEYSMYKTFAGKHRITMTQAKLKYTKDNIFSVTYETKNGTKKAEFYRGGFTRNKTPLLKTVDVMPEYWQKFKPREIFYRIQAGTCELCGQKDTTVMVHQVPLLSDLTGKHRWERIMLQKRRKTLIVCKDCHSLIHKNDVDD